MAENGLFAPNSRALAQPRDLSQFTPVRELNHRLFMADITSVNIDSVLAQVAVQVEPNAKFVSLKVYGDEEMAHALHITSRFGHLTLSGELPFTDKVSDGRRNPLRKLLQSLQQALLSNTSAVVNNGNTDTRVIVDGRRVDLDRKILIVLTIPQRMAIRASDRFYGLLAVGPQRMDDLILDSYGFAKIYVHEADRLEATTYGMGRIEAGTIQNELIASTRGQGSITIGQVHGSSQLKVHDMGRILLARAYGAAVTDVRGMGSVTISGGELQSGAFISRSMGDTTCKAPITGDATATVASSAMGSIALASVHGTFTKNVKGMGTVTANGRTYSRSLW